MHTLLPPRFINLPDIYGRTALHCIAWSGDVRGAQTLLSAGARLTAQAISDCYDMELPCNSGATPLHVATLKENVDMVLLILNAYVQGLESGSCVEDPRAIMDAYSVLPHAIADKHGKEDLEQVRPGYAACGNPVQQHALCHGRIGTLGPAFASVCW